MIYKIILEVVANRLKEVLNKIISPYQSAFVQGRYIADNYIIAHEIYYAFFFKKKKKTKTFELYLNMSKAYDQMECDFLVQTMNAMGFHNDFIPITM